MAPHPALIDARFAEVHAPVLEHASRTGLVEVVGEGSVFATLDAAVRHAEERA